MKKIDWFFKKKRIIVEEPNKELGKSYLEKADDALKQISNSVDKNWEMQAAYYAIYHSTYSLLVISGIKSESHAATFEILKELFDNYFSKEDIKFISKAHDIRNELQYYVDRSVEDEELDRYISSAPEWVVRCKGIFNSINEKDIKMIRDRMEKLK